MNIGKVIAMKLHQAFTRLNDENVGANASSPSLESTNAETVFRQATSYLSVLVFGYMLQICSLEKGSLNLQRGG